MKRRVQALFVVMIFLLGIMSAYAEMDVGPVETAEVHAAEEQDASTPAPVETPEMPVEAPETPAEAPETPVEEPAETAAVEAPEEAPLEPEPIPEPEESAAPESPEAPAEPDEAPTPEATEEPSPEVTLEVGTTPEPVEEQAEEQTIVSSYVRDAEGELVLDGNGNPIPILAPDAQRQPAAWQRDGSGALVLDKNGEPIATQYVPTEAAKLAAIQGALAPDRSIEIRATWDGELEFGEEACLTAVLHGYDAVSYELQWQVSADNANWSDVEGMTDSEYRLVVTEENYQDYWRVVVTVTDVRAE